MKVEVSCSNPVCFEDLKPGDCFKSIRSGLIYLKLATGLTVNVVDLNDGMYGTMPQNAEVKHYPNAKVVTGDGQ